MSDKPSKHGLATIPMKVGPGAARARKELEERPERCEMCGADLAGTGPLVAAWFEAPDGTACCSLECAS